MVERTMGILQTVLPVIIMLGLGVLARRRAMLSREGIDALKRVVVDIALPAVLLGAFSSARYDVNSLILPLVMFGGCVLALALGFLAQRALKLAPPLAPYMASGYEAGMLGYALFALLYGKGNTSSFALLDLGQVLFVFTLYKVLLSRSQGEGLTVGAAARSMLVSPTIWAIAVGVTLGATGLYRAMIPSGAAALLTGVTDFVSAPTGAIILLTIGYDLVVKEIRWRDALGTVLMRLVISGAMLWIMLSATRALFPGDVVMKGAVLLMFVLPPPFVLPIFADDPDSRAYVASSLSALTLASIAAFALIAAFA